MEKNEFYKSLVWKKLRAEHLKNNPYCANGLSLGQYNPGLDVHHILRYDLLTDEDLRYELATDPENLVTVTNEIHHDIHGRKKYCSPVFQQWLYDMKNYLCLKYLLKGQILIWTEDNTHKRTYKKVNKY